MRMNLTTREAIIGVPAGLVSLAVQVWLAYHLVYVWPRSALTFALGVLFGAIVVVMLEI